MLFVNAQWTKSSRYTLNKKISPHHVEQAPDIHNIKGHAPRERVSWNASYKGIGEFLSVTLHVSVWVEIVICARHIPTHKVTLHVSVWVEMITDFSSRVVCKPSRSTWACELKCWLTPVGMPLLCHAPRERVSWNTARTTAFTKAASHAPRERVSWNALFVICLNWLEVTLHVSVWVEIP